jgi:branched-chain amino acid transport system ATP-binding protein
VLLLDEPAAGLGPQDRERMAELIAALPRELTILLIEHDIDLTLGIVDRVLCLHYGELVADEPSDRVHEHPVVREIYLGADTEQTP